MPDTRITETEQTVERHVDPLTTTSERHVDAARDNDTIRFIQQERLGDSIPPQHLERFQLEQYDYDRDISSFRNVDTGRFVHVDSGGQFYNQQAEPITKEIAVSHALDTPSQIEQHILRDSPESQQGL